MLSRGSVPHAPIQVEMTLAQIAEIMHKPLADERDHFRAALEHAATALADASEALDILGAQVDASDAHQAHGRVREALEGPADA